MKVSLSLRYGNSTYVGEAELQLADSKTGPSLEASVGPLITAGPKTPTVLVMEMYKGGFFGVPRTLADVRSELEKLGVHLKDSTIGNTLDRAKFLHRNGAKRPYTYAQKYPAT